MIRKLAKTSSSRGGVLRARLLGGLLALALLPSLAGAQTVADKVRIQREQRSLFNLTSAPTMVAQVNQFQCGLNSSGDTCTDVFDSPTGGGGFWPAGSPNQYMFNSGLQVMGIIPKAASCANKATGTTPTCFAWSGDTTGAFFMDAAGTRKHGTPLTDIYNSLDANDLANWPTAGFNPDFPFLDANVTDTALFNPVLIGLKAASQQDTWVAYWDGDPNRTGGRTHPMGIVVEQRTMAWNYPTGNESVIYFIYKFTNVTNNPTFQRINEAKYSISLPDAGWTFDSIFVDFDSDPDVGPATNNHATAVLPFNMGIAYEGPMYDDAFYYPPALFHAPFFPKAPGIVGIKYLKSPINKATGEEVGMTSFSQHTNGGAFPDPSTVQQGWRYVSLNVDAGKGDPACSFALAEVKARRSCYLSQTQSDVRMFVGSGPFQLGPGESATIAVAMYAAATVNTPEITSSPSADNKPGLPSLAPGCFGEPIRAIEKGAGYIGPKAGGCPAEQGQKIDQFNVNVVPGSLLGKALVAQSIFDNKFLLGFAPEAPNFYLVPGNNQVTVVWEPSKTEQTGDPFFAASGDPTNPLYDPNYRRFDVEGYRIYRGLDPSRMELIAQFDKAGSKFTDVLCTVAVDGVTPVVTGEPCTDVHEVDITAPFVQYSTVALLANGDPIVLAADTALNAEIAAGRARPLEDTGIPYAYIDNDVRNGFQYFYKVTAFDINSFRSGPSSLESAAPAKPTLPRKDVASIALSDEMDMTVTLKGGTADLNPNAPLPTIDANNGTFSGKMPPTNTISAVVLPFVPRLSADFTVEATIDSVIATGEGSGECPKGSTLQGTCWKMFTTMSRGSTKSSNVIYGFSPIRSAWDATPQEWLLGQIGVPFDADAASTFGIPSTAGVNAAVSAKFYEYIFSSAQEGQHNRRNGHIAGGSRWFSGANETVADPTALIRVGHLDGVDSIWSPINHTAQAVGVGQMAASTAIQCFPYIAAQVARSADFEVTWTGGKPTIKDLTHNVDMQYKPTVQASFGFLNNDANGNGVLDYDDFYFIPNVSPHAEWIGFCSHTDDPSKYVSLQNAPVIKPVSFSGSTGASLATPIGNGIAMYINGQIFMFKMNSLPADGTKWTLRMYDGEVRATTDESGANPSGYSFIANPRPPMVPGLKIQIVGKSAMTVDATALDLSAVHTVPDPYYAVSQFDLGPASKELQFVNLPAEATIRIYSLSGVLVDIVNHNDPTGGGVAKWNLRNRSNQFVASGVYLYHVSTPEGKEHVGKFTVINAGFAR